MNLDHISFSQLSLFDECPRSWYLEKFGTDIFGEKLEPLDNAFSQAGIIVHKVLEQWAKGELTKEELKDEFLGTYDMGVTIEFPPYLGNYSDRMRSAVSDYFDNFNGFEGYEVLSAEQPIECQIHGVTMLGYVDLILKDKQTGGIVIVDHKSKSLSTFKKEQKKMWRQQYLYATWVKDTYGIWPEKLAFNLFKEAEDGFILKEFDQKEYQNVLLWAADIIEKMLTLTEEEDFSRKAKPDNFCKCICSMRQHCEEDNGE